LTAINHGPHHTFRGYAAGAVDYISKPFDPWVLRAKVSVFVELYMKNCQLREQAALLRLQLEGDEKNSEEPKEPAGLLAELSARLAAVEEQAEALTKQLNDESTDAAAVATAAHLERKLTGLRRALDALEPGAGNTSSVPSQNRAVRGRAQPPPHAGVLPALRLPQDMRFRQDPRHPHASTNATRTGEAVGTRVPWRLRR